MKLGIVISFVAEPSPFYNISREVEFWKALIDRRMMIKLIHVGGKS